MKKLNLNQNKFWLPNIIDSNNRIIKSADKQINLVLKQLREEYLSLEDNNKDLYWETRPTRIFWLDPDTDEELFDYEYDRFLEVQRNNYYKEEVLKDFFSKLGYDEALEKINNNTDQKPGAVFPAITKNGNDFLPLVSFSGFIKINNHLRIATSLQCQALQPPQSLRDNFHTIHGGTSSARNDKPNCRFFEKPIEALKKKLNIEITDKYIPELALYREIDGESYDLAFVANILLEKHKHLFNIFPKLCCTGIVDENGNIKKIEHAKEKLEAAKHKGFNFIIFSYENKADIEESERIVFFNNIIELDNWLKKLAENKGKKRINHWLSIGGKQPTSKEFNSYFEATLNKGVSYWQYYLKYVTTDAAIGKINILLKKYLDFIFKENIVNLEDKLLRQVLILKNKLPTYRYYSLIPELINILKNYNKITDYLYNQINEAVNSQNPDLAIATKIIRENKTINDITDNQIIREKYPLLLCFYYKHPSELIYILSCLEKLTEKEEKLLDTICEFIDKKNNINENKLLNIAFNILKSNNNYQFEITAETITHSLRLALLEKSIENFQNKNKKKYIKSIEKYINTIKNIITDTAKAEKQINKKKKQLEKNIIIQNLKLKSNKKSQINNIQENIILNNYYKETFQNTFLTLGLNYELYCFLHSCNCDLNHKIKKAIPFNNNLISFNSYRNKYLLDFCANLNLGKMGELITESIAFFYGKYIVRFNNPKDLEIIIQKNKFDLPFIIGLLSQNNGNYMEKSISKIIHSKVRSLLIELFAKKKIIVRQLMWLYLLDNSLKKIIVTNLKKYLSVRYSSLTENTEFKREFEFISALFNISNKDSADFDKDAKNSIAVLKGNSQKTLTRTEELFYPIYAFLKYNKSNRFEFKKLGSQLNNSRFVVEFLRVFGKDSSINELFQPIHGFSDYEIQLFEIMTIIRLAQEKEYGLLKNYILNNISNIENLKFALDLLLNR